MLYVIGLIVIVGMVLGMIMDYLHLPKLLGYMIAGMIFGVSGFNIVEANVGIVSAPLRQIALIIILTRAGLTLDIDNLKKIGINALLMSFVPATFEIIGISLGLVVIMKMNIYDAMLIGSVLAAVSPAVIVPRMINLIERGKGSKHHVPELILSGASVDDVFAIVIFTSLLSLYSGSDIGIMTFLNAPVTIVLGIMVGILMGYVFKIMLKKIHLNLSYELIILLSMSFIILEIEDRLEGYFNFSGLIAIMTSMIVLRHLNKNKAIELSKGYNNLWNVFEILLFGLLGALVNISYALKAGVVVIIVIVIGLLFRMMGVVLSTGGMKLNLKERIFAMMAYMPKATVQAAISSIPLSMGLECGEMVLVFGVMSIIITAPLGAVLIDHFADRLL